MKHYPTATVLKIPNYMAGGKRGPAYIGTEFDHRYGFRSIVQRDKGAGVPGPVKFGEWCDIMVRRDPFPGEGNHDFVTLMRGKDSIIAGLDMITTHWELFTEEERRYMGGLIHKALSIDRNNAILHCGADREAITPLYEKPLLQAKIMAQTGLYYDISLDWEAIEALKKPVQA